MKKIDFIESMFTVEVVSEKGYTHSQLKWNNAGVNALMSRLISKYAHVSDPDEINSKAIAIAMEVVERWRGNYDDELWRLIFTTIQKEMIRNVDDNVKRMKMDGKDLSVTIDCASLQQLNDEGEELSEMINSTNIIGADDRMSDKLKGQLWAELEDKLTSSQMQAIHDFIDNGERIDSRMIVRIKRKLKDIEMADTCLVCDFKSLVESDIHNHEQALTEWLFANSKHDEIDDLLLNALSYPELKVFNQAKKTNSHLPKKIIYKIVDIAFTTCYHKDDSKNENVEKTDSSAEFKSGVVKLTPTGIFVDAN